MLFSALHCVMSLIAVSTYNWTKCLQFVVFVDISALCVHFHQIMSLQYRECSIVCNIQYSTVYQKVVN